MRISKSKSKSYRFKPVTLAQLEVLQEAYPHVSETEIVKEAINLLEYAMVATCSMPRPFVMQWRDLDGKSYKLTMEEV